MSKIQPIKIGNRNVGQGFPTYVIFEVASTHANNWDIAKDYVQQAKEAGADALKFQLYEADKLLNPISSILKPAYDYFKTAQTPKEWFPKLLQLCKKAGIDLLCTPFDENAATFLNSLGLPAVKIASGDLTNHQLLAHVAKFKKPVILSTGMATMDEVKQAVSILKKTGCREFALLQCTSVYPMPYEDTNIRAMQTLQNAFKTIVGYSDNGSKGVMVPLVAVAMGASVIEKHVTSRKNRGSMDDVFSLTVSEFAQMVKRIRQLEKDYRGHLDAAIKDLAKEFGSDVRKVLGSGIKKPATFGILREDGTRMLESDERHWARRGVYPKKDIPKGTKITQDMIISIRPDVGVSAVLYNKIASIIASEDLPAMQPILFERESVRRFKKSDIRRVYTDPSDKQFVDILEKTANFD